jgi:hypothetical protein
MTRPSTAIRLLAWAGAACLVLTVAVAGTASPLWAATVQSLAINPEKPTVGAEVVAAARGLPAGKTIELQWLTVDGGWVIEENYYFRGRIFTEAAWSLGQFRIGDDGTLNARFRIPEDFGGAHTVVAMLDGTEIAQGLADVTQSFEMSPKLGPPGTPIELKVTGMGWRSLESTWVVDWDNGEIGYVTGFSTRGTATARFRATGFVGHHEVKVYTGYLGQAYLNHEQAPNAYLPRPRFTFEVTPPQPVVPFYSDPYPVQPLPAVQSAQDISFGVSPQQGPVGSPLTLQGGGLSARAELSFTWQTMVGSRVSGSGYEPEVRPFATVTTEADGTFSLPSSVPDDLGGQHVIVMRNGANELARAVFVIETSIVGVTPVSGPAGTDVTIHLKGVGWTEFDNIYTAVYDNNYMGYACGFNSQGDVVINFTAAGAPGQHFIDLYPAIYTGTKDPNQPYRIPQLTYADDHPGNHIPALHFAITVTES